MNLDLLALSLLFLVAAITLVPLFKKAGLGSILGYLAAGVLLGPTGLHLLKDVNGLMHFAEFGVVMLLFLIGLELKPAKLWGMRKSLIGLGLVQVVLTSVALFLVLIFVGYSWAISLLIAVSLSLSSTAFALQVMSEKNQLKTQFGQNAFAILLFQDLMAIPLLAVVPVLSGDSSAQGKDWKDHLLMVSVFVGLGLFSRFLLRPLMRMVAQTRTKEVFTALTLFLVLGVSYLMREIGLSMALGAFIAGILLSDSEYRHQVETDLEPFKGLLLGLFFIAIGMTVNFDVIMQKPQSAFLGVVILVAIKYAVVYGIGKFIKLNHHSSKSMAVVLAQGGEFAFVVFASAFSFKLISENDYNYFLVLVTFSMIASALLSVLQDKMKEWMSKFVKIEDPVFDKIDDKDNPIIIAGFGRVGQISGRMLRSIGHKFTALELDPEQVEVIRRFGNQIYYGDASRLDLLETAGAAQAKIFVLAIDDVEVSIAVAKLVREHFPKLKIFARARNRSHLFELRELGVEHIWRETFSSSLEMAEGILEELGFSEEKVADLVKTFCEKDHELLEEQYKVHRDEGDMIAASKQGAEQLQQLLSERVKV